MKILTLNRRLLLIVAGIVIASLNFFLPDFVIAAVFAAGGLVFTYSIEFAVGKKSIIKSTLWVFIVSSCWLFVSIIITSMVMCQIILSANSMCNRLALQEILVSEFVIFYIPWFFIVVFLVGKTVRIWIQRN